MLFKNVTYNVPDTVLGALNALSQVTLTTNLWYYHPHFRIKNLSLREIKKWSKITQIKSGRTKIQPKFSLTCEPLLLTVLFYLSVDYLIYWSGALEGNLDCLYTCESPIDKDEQKTLGADKIMSRVRR